ncbi:hypothetical protein [Actinomadura rubteroloni]|uniref:hypothetical protein n=1 Tax=Actinomadura rubteroloni TaxID=1926885 RepID=UPI000CD90F98|nr:hypothetical protein [Actinomadura rubteroloni]
MGTERRVLAVARTLTSATRVLDALTVFDGDRRVEVAFTLHEGSAFSPGAGRFLSEYGAPVIPWRDAARERFDLAVAATSNGALHRLRAPLVIMPHGAGHNRIVPSATGRRDVASGLAPRQLTRWGRPVPALIALSHPEQLERLRRSCPAAVGRAAVVGDPCFDRIVGSLPLREVYRSALGVAPGQRLTVVSSTWGPHSLFAAHVGSLGRWVADLPVDAHRVALVLHPNIWGRYGAPQIRTWLRDALEAGLALIPPEEGWRAALVAADDLIGDHGSVTYYGAALGRPVLLAAFGDAELDPASPLMALRAACPRLERTRPLHAQLGALHPPRLPGDILTHHGEAMANLASALYRTLRLTPPADPPAVPSVPAPVAEKRRVTALTVEGRAAGPGVELVRYPAAVRRDELEEPHLVVTAHETDRRLLNSAAVLVREDVLADPADWTAATLAARPGAALAAAALAGGHVRLHFRDGRVLRARGADPALCASAVYVATLFDRPADPVLHVRVGGRDIGVECAADAPP